MKTAEKSEVQARIRGVLIGGAYGDAMGMPTEFWTQEHIKKRFPEGIVQFLPSQKEDFFGRTMSAGEVTDDTINTLMIARMLIENHGMVNTDAYIKRLIQWKNESEVAALVCGPSTLKALEAIERGMSVEVTGKLGTTNGAAMKISPIGIVSDYQDLEGLIAKVSMICKPSHNTSIAIQGASIIAGIISYVVSGGTSMQEIWSLAERIAYKAKSSGFQIPSASLIQRMELARNVIRDCPEEVALQNLYEVIGTGVETIETIPSVLAIVELAGGNPLLSAKLSASLGGDTDTIGAIATAICGGMNPDFHNRIVKKLEQVNGIDFDNLGKNIYPFSPFTPK